MAGKAENAIALASTLAAVAVTKKVVDATWKVGSGGKTPPTDPTDPDVELREAITWAVLSGVAISLTRLFMARRLARGDRRKNRVVKAVAP